MLFPADCIVLTWDCVILIILIIIHMCIANLVHNMFQLHYIVKNLLPINSNMFQLHYNVKILLPICDL